MKLDYRVLELGDEGITVTERVAVWEDAARVAAKPTRVVDIVGTDETVDRHNTKILVDGWELRDFQNNPVLLWSHNMDPAVSTMPVGRIIGVFRETATRADQRVVKRLVFRAEFPAEGTYPFADLVYKMYDSKFLRASSVGFRNLKLRRLDPADDDDKQYMEKEGFDAKHPFGAAVLEKNALMELSAVPVGSNPNALAKGLRESAPAELRGLVDAPEGGVEIDDAWIAERFEALRLALAPEPEEYDEVGGEQRKIKKVGTEWCVFSKDGTKKLGCHPTKEAALKQLQAVEANKAAPWDLAELPEIIKKCVDDAFAAGRADVVKVLTELETLKQLTTQLSSQVADLGDAERVAGDEPTAPAQADPLDVILGENEEALRRISSLLK